MAEPAEVSLVKAEPELTEGPGLRVVPSLRARALSDGLVLAVVAAAVLVGVGWARFGLFGVAGAVALLIVAALVKDEGPRVWRRVRRGPN